MRRKGFRAPGQSKRGKLARTAQKPGADGLSAAARVSLRVLGIGRDRPLLKQENGADDAPR